MREVRSHGHQPARPAQLGGSAAEYAIVLAVIVIGIVAAEGALASLIGNTLQNVTAEL